MLEPLIEAALDFDAEAVSVRAGFRAPSHAVAGGILAAEFFVNNHGPAPFYLALAMDRTRLRPEYISFSARLETTAIVFSDPLSQVEVSGGPATTIVIQPGDSFSQPLIVNEFLDLEQARRSLVNGEKQALFLACQRQLPLAQVATQAFQFDQHAPLVEVTLVLNIERDDTALELTIQQLADKLHSDWVAAPVSAEREQAAMRLIALRTPLILPLLRELSQHPDPAVRRHVQRGLAFSSTWQT